jgi:hypothetical protein
VPCYWPLPAWQTSAGAVLFVERGNDIVRELRLACGQCFGCRLSRSRQWAVRCMHEAQLRPNNCFVTLTYSDENLPPGRSLHYRDFQLFMFKMQKRFGGVRFYMCGEYGELTHRPHYHACLFNHQFDDLKFLKGKDKSKLYTSALLDRMWGLGQCTVGEVTFESAAYTARYIMKKLTGGFESGYDVIDPDTLEVVHWVPEFTRMSNRPGIGTDWFKLFGTDVYPEGKVVARGHKQNAPAYYDRLWKRMVDEYDYDDLAQERALEARKSASDCSPERLDVREVVDRAAMAHFSREI